MKKEKTIHYGTKKMIDMQDKGARDYWLRKWGVSIHQLSAAVRMVNSYEVKKVREELGRKGAVEGGGK